MAVPFRWSRILQRKRPPSKILFCRRHYSIDATHSLEEETLPLYQPDHFYPVRIGEVFRSQYKVVGKLGYGAFSTTWLCRDLKHDRHVALKVLTQTPPNSRGWINREWVTYQHLSTVESIHPGQAYIRALYDCFDVYGPDGHHYCLVHPPMHRTLGGHRNGGDGRKNWASMDETAIRGLTVRILKALDFLHREAGVIHADLKPCNLMFGFADKCIFTEFEEAEAQDPSPRKVIDENRTIYASRAFRPPKKPGLYGEPVLCDLGEARIGDAVHHGYIQPKVYMAPEVLFKMGWTYSADIWNLGAMLWDLFENRRLFYALDEEKQYSPSHHIAEMVGYLGTPPREFLKRSSLTANVFGMRGTWLGRGGVDIPDVSLEKVETRLEGRSKELFLQFIRSMMKWLPEERMTARELLDHPWLKAY